MRIIKPSLEPETSIHPKLFFMNALNKIILTISLLLLAATAFPQMLRDATYKNYLTDTSMRQKHLGRVLLIKGVTASITGAVDQKNPDATAPGFVIDLSGIGIAIPGGGAALAGSIVLSDERKAAKL